MIDIVTVEFGAFSARCHDRACAESRRFVILLILHTEFIVVSDE